MALYHTVKGPVDYTVVGTPTITNGIASGFSESNYIVLSQNFPSTSSWKAVAKFTYLSGSGTEYIMGNANTFTIKLYNNGLRFTIKESSSSTINYNGPEIYALTQGETIWASLEFTGQEYKMSYSLDGVNFVLGDTYVSATNVRNNLFIAFGHMAGSSFTGSIDLNNTYIKVNGQAWFCNCPIEVKKHQLMGSVGYTVVGSPTITDGVASGFSASNYTQMLSSINIKQGQDFEFNINFKTGAQISQTNPLFAVGYDGIGYGAGINIVSNKAILWQLFNIGGEHALGSVDLDSTYVLSIKRTNGEYIVSNLYKEGVLVNTTSWTSNAGESTNNLVRIGRSYTADNGYFQGSIDLNHTYIKVNGKLWFYQPAPTKYIIHEDNITHDKKLVFADQGLYLTGPNAYTVTGSPSITDDIVSNITTSNFLSINNTLAVGQNPWEVYCKFTTGSNVSSYQTIYSLQVDNSYAGRGGIGLKIADTGKLEISLSSDGSSWLLVGYTDDSISANTTYYTKQYFENGYYKLDLSTDGVTYTNVINLSSSGFVNNSLSKCYIGIWNDSNYTMPFLGSIDLKNTYIKVNDQLWFYGKNYATKNIAPVPSGFQLNNTTTPQIGYIDMRTQQYHKAPAGTALVSPGGKTTYDDYVIEDGKLVFVDSNIYLESIGTQYINTGVPSAFDTLVVDATFMKTQNLSSENSLFGGKSLGDDQAPTIYQSGNDSYLLSSWCGSGTSDTITYGYELNTKYNLRLSYDGASGRTWTLNGVNASSTIANNARNNPGNLAIFADGSSPMAFFAGRIYEFKLIRNGVLVRDLIPVPQGLVIGNYTVPSNGMFDMVNQQFYANQGTGEFTIGRDE